MLKTLSKQFFCRQWRENFASGYFKAVSKANQSRNILTNTVVQKTCMLQCFARFSISLRYLLMNRWENVKPTRISLLICYYLWQQSNWWQGLWQWDTSIPEPSRGVSDYSLGIRDSIFQFRFAQGHNECFLIWGENQQGNFVTPLVNHLIISDHLHFLLPQTNLFCLLTSILPEIFIFLKKMWRTKVLLVEPLIPLFWTFGDVCPGFQSLSRSFLCDFLPVWSSDSTLVWHLLIVEISMAAKPFQSRYLQTCPQALVEVRSSTYIVSSDICSQTKKNKCTKQLVF